MSTERTPYLVCGWTGSMDEIENLLAPLNDGDKDLESALSVLDNFGMPAIKNSKYKDHFEYVYGQDSDESGLTYFGMAYKYAYDVPIDKMFNILKEMEGIMGLLAEHFKITRPTFHNVISWY